MRSANAQSVWWSQHASRSDGHCDRPALDRTWHSNETKISYAKSALLRIIDCRYYFSYLQIQQLLSQQEENGREWEQEKLVIILWCFCFARLASDFLETEDATSLWRFIHILMDRYFGSRLPNSANHKVPVSRIKRIALYHTKEKTGNIKIIYGLETNLQLKRGIYIVDISMRGPTTTKMWRSQQKINFGVPNRGRKQKKSMHLRKSSPTCVTCGNAKMKILLLTKRSHEL